MSQRMGHVIYPGIQSTEECREKIMPLKAVSVTIVHTFKLRIINESEVFKHVLILLCNNPLCVDVC